MRKAAKPESGAIIGPSAGRLALLLYSQGNQRLVRALSFTFRSAARIRFCSKIEDVLSALRTRSFHALLLSTGIRFETPQPVISSAFQSRTPVFLMATQATFQPAMFFAGLDGIIEPRLTVREFHDALAQARSGHFVAPRWFNRRISEIIRLSFIGYRSDYIHLMHLTAPEVKVIDLVAQHFENKEIAEKLALSGPLVGKLVRSIYSKLGVRRRTEAAVL